MRCINHNIKFYRLHNRYTQQEIADKLKTTLGRIKTYESGVAVPQVDMIIKIASMLHISIDTLIKVKLSEENYFKSKQEKYPPDLISRIEALEKNLNGNATNKNVNKILKTRVSSKKYIR